MPVLITLAECFRQFGVTGGSLATALESWRRAYGVDPDFMVLAESTFLACAPWFGVDHIVDQSSEHWFQPGMQ